MPKSLVPDLLTQLFVGLLVDAISDCNTLNHGKAIAAELKALKLPGLHHPMTGLSFPACFCFFRSSRSGHKNLYIIDAVDGEKAALRRLTDGPWTDTMCSWSPDGEWIAFSSDRDDPGSGGFALYLVHPNGTGLRKVFHSGADGRANHASFSPDSRRFVFTSDYAAVSAEPISNPHSYQSYGEICTVRIDGSGIRRLTHNSFEDGTPAWSAIYMEPLQSHV